jgi:hypothetical protein
MSIVSQAAAQEFQEFLPNNYSICINNARSPSTKEYNISSVLLSPPVRGLEFRAKAFMDTSFDENS